MIHTIGLLLLLIASVGMVLSSFHMMQSNRRGIHLENRLSIMPSREVLEAAQKNEVLPADTVEEFQLDLDGSKDRWQQHLDGQEEVIPGLTRKMIYQVFGFCAFLAIVSILMLNS